MKKFLLHSLLFCSIFLLVIFYIEYQLKNIPNSYTIKRNCLEENLSAIKVINLGTSQAHYGINPSIIDEQSCNLANSNQDLYFDNQILAQYVDTLPNLQLVILPISYFSLEFKLADSDESWRKFFYYHFLDIKLADADLFDIKKYSYLALYSPKQTLEFMQQNFNISLIDHNTPNGWFKVGGKINNEVDKGKQRAALNTAQMNKKYLDENIKTLESSIQLLQQKNIKVVLVTLPVNKTYSENIDTNKYKKMTTMVDFISKKYDIAYLSYFNNNYFTEDDFYDNSDHLNSNGAIKFTKLFKNDIKYSF